MAGSVSDAFAGRPVISRGFFLLIHGVEIDWLQQQRWETAVGNEVVYMLTHEREQCIRAGGFERPLPLLRAQSRDGEHPRLLNFYQEGGLATGVHELAEAARLGALVEKDTVPISKEGAAICSTLGIDPFGVITSGALLLAVPPENENFLRGILEGAGGLGVRIGTLLPSAEGVTILQSGKRFPLPRFDADEISKVL